MGGVRTHSCGDTLRHGALFLHSQNLHYDALHSISVCFPDCHSRRPCMKHWRVAFSVGSKSPIYLVPQLCWANKFERRRKRRRREAGARNNERGYNNAQTLGELTQCCRDVSAHNSNHKILHDLDIRCYTRFHRGNSSLHNQVEPQVPSSRMEKVSGEEKVMEVGSTCN